VVERDERENALEEDEMEEGTVTILWSTIGGGIMGQGQVGGLRKDKCGETEVGPSF